MKSELSYHAYVWNTIAEFNDNIWIAYMSVGLC
jgi:hypothetical protein